MLRGIYLRQHWGASGSIDEWCVHMENSMMEVCVRVGAGSCAQQAFPLLAPQKGDVLNHVSYALLICLLIDAACNAPSCSKLMRLGRNTTTSALICQHERLSRLCGVCTYCSLTSMHFEMCFKPLWGHLVGQHDISQTIVKLTQAQIVCLRQVLTQQLLHGRAAFAHLQHSLA